MQRSEILTRRNACSLSYMLRRRRKISESSNTGSQSLAHSLAKIKLESAAESSALVRRLPAVEICAEATAAVRCELYHSNGKIGALRKSASVRDAQHVTALVDACRDLS
jgi:hypothetical protein